MTTSGPVAGQETPCCALLPAIWVLRSLGLRIGRIRMVRFIGVIAMMLSCAAGQASADDLARSFAENTYLLGISQGSGLSSVADAAAHSGYELADGSFQSFHSWYRPDWTDMRFDMLTQLNDNVGLLWGVTTGESGEKYWIEPSLTIGLIAQQEIRPGAVLSLTMTGTFWGKLRERACVADYGDISGPQPVNCRLAASELSPDATLGYLWNEDPGSRFSIGVKFSMKF